MGSNPMCPIACAVHIHKECAAQPENWFVNGWCFGRYTCPAECVTLTRQSCCQDAMMFQQMFCWQCTCPYFALGLVAKHVATPCQLLALGNMCIARGVTIEIIRGYSVEAARLQKNNAAVMMKLGGLSLQVGGKDPMNILFTSISISPTTPKVKSIWFAPVPGQDQHDRDLLRHHAHLISMGANSPASCRALGWHGSGQN